MVRYNSRSRRRRRPRYRRRGGNRIRLYMVLTIVMCATIYFAFRWQGGRAADPNDVNGVSGEVVAATDFEQPNESEPTQTESPAPAVERSLPPQPEIHDDPVPVDLVPAPRPVVVEVNPKVDTMVAEATALLSQDPEGKLIEARDRLNTILSESMGTRQRTLIKGKLTDLAQKWLLSAKVYPGDALCETYKVKQGDNLQRIGRRNAVPYEILMTINKIRKPESLMEGVNIKVVKGPFHVKVYKSSFTMDLYLQDNLYVKSYPIGLGKVEHETPTGLWAVKIGGKMIQPPWTDPEGRVFNADHPDYPLGSRYIELKGLEGDAVGRTGFAIHGTKEPEQIGKRASMGCIRLHNGNAREVFELLTQEVSQVTVLD